MEVEILNDGKNELDVQLDNPTIAEVLRMRLNEEGVDFAAWRRDHPSKPAIFKIKTSGKTPKKAIGDAVASLKKDLVELEKSVK